MRQQPTIFPTPMISKASEASILQQHVTVFDSVLICVNRHVSIFITYFIILVRLVLFLTNTFKNDNQLDKTVYFLELLAHCETPAKTYKDSQACFDMCARCFPTAGDRFDRCPERYPQRYPKRYPFCNQKISKGRWVKCKCFVLQLS